MLSYKPMLFTAGWALLLTGLLGLLPRLARRIAMMLLILLFSVLTLVHCAIFRHQFCRRRRQVFQLELSQFPKSAAVVHRARRPDDGVCRISRTAQTGKPEEADHQ